MARFKRIFHSILVAIAAGAASPVNLTAAISDNLAGYWKLDETSGPAAADASGNGNIGSLVGSPIWEAGRINGGLSFNGNDSVDAGSGASLDNLDNQGLGGMTVAFWIRPTASVSADIIRKSWWGAWNIALTATNNTLGLTFYKHFSSTALNVAFQNQLTLNQWRHVILTWNGQAPISAVALYVDGALKAYSSGTAGAGTKVSDANEDLLISSPRFSGSLDEVRLYSRVLTAAEVSQLYNDNGGSTPPPPADTNAPVRSNGAPSGTLAAGTTAATLSLTTDEAAVCKCDTRANIPYASMTTTFATTGGTSHSQTVSGLTDGNTYTFYGRCRDAANNANGSDYPISFSIASPAASWTYSETALVTGLQQPTAMEFAPDGRLFVLEQSGRIRVVKNGTLLATSFTTLTVNATGERGLLGLAFDPNFANNRYLYIYHTVSNPQIHNRISRLRASLSNPDVSDGTQTILFDALPTLGAAQHNGGALHFGADAKLYVAVGENGISYSSQSISNLLGKMLRLNPDGTIPSDNPSSFAGIGGSTTGWNRAIWAVGLRNPFTFAIDPLTGRMHINDVGSSDQIAWEEINVGAAGANYGWPTCEGTLTRGTSSACSNPNFSAPLYAYWHGSNRGGGLSAAITGGTFYRGNQFPAEYYGAYFFADTVDNFIDVLMPNGELRNLVNATAGPGPVDLDVGPDGALYYLSYAWASMGGVYRISAVSGANHQPHADFIANPAAGPAPLTVHFDGSASSDPDNNILAFHWDFGDGSTLQGVELRQVNHTFGSDGQYLVTLEVVDGGGLQHSASLMVVVGNGPVGVITAPAPNMSYNAGDRINYSGSASDAEDGTLPASAFAWTVVFHHDDHTHPFLGPIYGVRQGNFTIPVNGETDTDVFYRIHLSVTDSSGIEDDSYVDILPRKVLLTLAANIAGATLELEGVSHTALYTFESVVGLARTISAPVTQTINGQTYQFVSWSDGGSRTHQIFTPANNTSYSATYQLSP